MKKINGSKSGKVALHINYDRFHIRWIILSAFIFLSACTTTQVKMDDSLKKNLAKEIASLTPEHGIWGAIIVDLDVQDTLLLVNPEMAFKPASITKLFTVAAANKLLPPVNFASMQFNQISQTDSTIDSLYWIGAGLTLAGEENIDSLYNLGLAKLKKTGVKEITDAIVFIDPSDKEALFPGWTMEDASAWFASKPSITASLSNLWEVKVNRFSDSLAYEIFPHSPMQPAVDLIDSKDFFYRWNFGEFQIPYLIAGLPLEEYHRKFYVPMHRPIYVWGQRFKDLVIDQHLADPSVSLVYTNYFPHNKPTVMTYPVVELDSLFILANTLTDNFTAESLLRTMGMNMTGVYGREAGLAAMDSVFKNDFIHNLDYHFLDGSGMSRYNWVRPSAVCRILMRDYYGQHLEGSLSVAGKSGTLKRRLGEFPNGTYIRGKTGSMNGVRNFSGFMTLPNGQSYLVAFFVNQYTVPTKQIDTQMRQILLQIIYGKIISNNVS